MKELDLKENILENKNLENTVLERKFMPMEDVYEGGCMQKSFESFLNEALLTKHASYSIPCKDQIFFSAMSDNPFRELATFITTNYESFELPVLSAFCEGQVATKEAFIEGKLWRDYVNIQVSSHIAERLSRDGNSEYIKSRLLQTLLATEIDKCIQQEAKDGYSAGLLKSVALNREKTSDLGSTLLNMQSKLDYRYRKNAVYIMSSTMLYNLASIKDTTGRHIWDGQGSLYGHKVVAVDSMEDNVVFGDFKAGSVFVSLKEHKMESRLVSHGKMEFSLSLDSAFAIVDDKAFVGIEVELVEADKKENKQ